MADGGDLLAILQRIAVALEERNAMARRETMKAEPGERPREYLGQGRKEPTDDQGNRKVRRPRAASHS